MVGALIESAPDRGPHKTSIQALPKSPQVLGHRNEAFGGRASRPRRLLMRLIHIRAFAQKDLVNVFPVELAVLRTAVTSIGDRAARRGRHALSKALESWAIKRLLMRVANEGLGGDHKALAIQRHLQSGATFGFGMTLALRDGAGIEVIE